jgi:hypothetical protein
MLFQHGGPFGDPVSSNAEEVAIGGVVLKISFLDEPREKLEKQGIDVVALTEDAGAGLRRRWKAVDAAGHTAWGRSRTEALQKALSRALGGSKMP